MTENHHASYPSLFVSHGAPTLALEDCAVTRFLTSLGQKLGKPKAILIISAHFDQRRPTIACGERLETIYDFGGFPAALYEVRYPARGSSEIAVRVGELLLEAGIASDMDETRGMDHGCWVPLVHMYPNADVPIVQLSISMGQSPQWHFELGQALSGLREEGVLIIGSGSASHNLRELMMGQHDEEEPMVPWVLGVPLLKMVHEVKGYTPVRPMVFWLWISMPLATKRKFPLPLKAREFLCVGYKSGSEQ